MNPEQKRAMLNLLYAAGISTEAIATTLLRENQPALREWIVNREWNASPATSQMIKYRGLYVCPALFSDAMRIKSELVFQVAAKEMLREGASVYYTSLTDLGAYLMRSDSHDGNLATSEIDTADIVFISRFYCGDDPHFIAPSGETRECITAWALRRYKTGKALAVSASSGIAHAEKWWSSVLLEYMRHAVMEYTVQPVKPFVVKPRRA